MKARLLLAMAICFGLLWVGWVMLAQAQEPLPVGQTTSLEALGSAFTYQGRLLLSGTPVSGTCDLQFTLWDALTNGTQVGITQTHSAVPVSNGLFTVLLDFGAAPFRGDARWLEVSVRSPAGLGSYTTLRPRQALTAVPYALYAKTAPWSGLVGVPSGFADGVDNDTLYSAGTGLTLLGGTFSVDTATIQQRVTGACGAGYAIRQVNANGTVLCEPVGAGAAWLLTGNAGTSPGVNFLGTTDNQALELKVNNARALRLEPTSDSPNLIGGYSGNNVTGGVWGATIGGGGTSRFPNWIGTNGFGATIGGGYGNQASALHTTVGGGVHNTASGEAATVGGGDANTANTTYATVAGGWDNNARALGAAVSGGGVNTASSDYATVGGGYYNIASAITSTIGGGEYIRVTGAAAAVAGGSNITATGNYAFIGGGHYNVASGYASVVGGGGDRYIYPYDPYSMEQPLNRYGNTASGALSTVGGGAGNSASGKGAVVAGGGGWFLGTYGTTFLLGNTANGDWATVSGGRQNQAVENATVAGGMYNRATGRGSVVGGGGVGYYKWDEIFAGNTASGELATVDGGAGNVASGYASVVGGGGGVGRRGDDLYERPIGNTAADEWATVGGGAGNYAGPMATVAGGVGNVASGRGAVVGGGGGSYMDGPYFQPFGNIASGDWSTVGGGEYITATGRAATVAGGSYITATGDYVAVGGGLQNSATYSYATVGGGQGNKADGSAATVGGGQSNTASGVRATIGGGAGNVATAQNGTIAGGYYVTVTGSYGTVGGGRENLASGMYATASGGWGNSATALHSTVPGGYFNTAAGMYSFAAGSQAKAMHNGSFVWADAGVAPFSSTLANQFAVRATGGVYLYTNSALTSGAYLASGSGSWGLLSDRNMKENLRPVQVRDVLKRLAEIPINTWNYTSQDSSIRHMGPAAQDLYAAFGLGEDETHISTVDADGISLAAIQGLYELSQEQAARIQELEAQNAALEVRLAALEAALAKLLQDPGRGKP